MREPSGSHSPLWTVHPLQGRQRRPRRVSLSILELPKGHYRRDLSGFLSKI